MPDPRRRSGGVVMVILLCGLLGPLVALGCGRKAPPKPPQRPPLPQAADLAVQLQADRVRLIWTLAPLEAPLAAVAHFVVHRDALALSAGPCADCPPRYEMVGRVAYTPNAPRRDGALRFQFTETVAAGFRYRYQVALRLADGRQGEPSKPVEVTRD
ncbi:MAG: hypothetical protein QNJ22_02390 [Desulfosarcinaceae bacterium]|nr:hypothetical protein [Desulfosarcinaceae bacterium]